MVDRSRTRNEQTIIAGSLLLTDLAEALRAPGAEQKRLTVINGALALVDEAAEEQAIGGGGGGVGLSEDGSLVLEGTQHVVQSSGDVVQDITSLFPAGTQVAYRFRLESIAIRDDASFGAKLQRGIAWRSAAGLLSVNDGFVTEVGVVPNVGLGTGKGAVAELDFTDDSLNGDMFYIYKLTVSPAIAMPFDPVGAP